MIHNPYDDTYLLSLIVIIDAICDAILEDTVAIREVTDAEAILTETAGQITTTVAEQNLYINNAPAGIFRPVCVKIDFTNQTAAETVVIRTYYRISPAAGALLILQDTVTYAGVVSPELINIDLEPNRYGVAVTIQNTAVGEHQAYDWEVFYEEAP
ncbi:unnamed protein product [marine sediment metagenome]|uniref:H-type lectin domain-containing protein n=1 Tax=marine sediment metagenome TaxID=412755 RepID=X0Z8K9_9ZZZZ